MLTRCLICGHFSAGYIYLMWGAGVTISAGVGVYMVVIAECYNGIQCCAYCCVVNMVTSHGPAGGSLLMGMR